MKDDNGNDYDYDVNVNESKEDDMCPKCDNSSWSDDWDFNPGSRIAECLKCGCRVKVAY